MNDLSASPANARSSTAGTVRVLVWDMPIRVFHWLTVLSFAGAYLTAESERWRLLHVTLGYTMGGLVVFRLVWGFVGTRYARFSDFVQRPARIWSYLRGLIRRRPEHYVGHNPAGALAIVAMLTLALAVTASGWALYNDIGGDALEEIHEAAANIMLAIVGLHVMAVLLSSWLHHENLIGAMFTGYKRGMPEEAIRHAWRSVAALMLVAVLGFWWLQWHNAPPAENRQTISMKTSMER
ncbi:cytochrome b/b6 domain-containing protein [Noviherbaspirillum pedocola]|uniref:Cytochrome b/b6 domain-containing protein n=1 Tax=Noviherbaspirillum pedocola TaxID=2801341 RepID=A0A934SXY9_9BURK|nr:cytochrome b/b6 domain-containing protein [Noviherbaspirillum pedocola]MBK4738600.1 cytochrome b/b6 domain-containing protein [Noviherbaspirillum pedocola]